MNSKGAITVLKNEYHLWLTNDFNKMVCSNEDRDFVEDKDSFAGGHKFVSSVVRKEPKLGELDVFRFYVLNRHGKPILKAPDIPYPIEQEDVHKEPLCNMTRFMSYIMPQGAIQLYVYTLAGPGGPHVQISTTSKANAFSSYYHFSLSSKEHKRGIGEMFHNILDDSFGAGFFDGYIFKKLRDPINSCDTWLICERNRLCHPFDSCTNLINYIYSISGEGVLFSKPELNKMMAPFCESIHEDLPYSIVSLWKPNNHTGSLYMKDFITTRFMNAQFRDVFNAIANEVDLLKRIFILKIMTFKTGEQIRDFYSKTKSSTYYNETRPEYFTPEWATEQYKILCKTFPVYGQLVELYYNYFVHSVYMFYTQPDKKLSNFANYFGPTTDISRMSMFQNTQKRAISVTQLPNEVFRRDYIEKYLASIPIYDMCKQIIDRMTTLRYNYDWETEEMRHNRVLFFYNFPTHLIQDCGSLVSFTNLMSETFDFLNSEGIVAYNLVPKLFPRIKLVSN